MGGFRTLMTTAEEKELWELRAYKIRNER